MFTDIDTNFTSNNSQTSVNSKIQKYTAEKSKLDSEIQDLNVQQKVLENELSKLKDTLKVELKLPDDFNFTADSMDSISSKLETKIQELEKQISNLSDTNNSQN